MILARTRNATDDERAQLYNLLGTSYANLNNKDKAAENYLYSLEYKKNQTNALKYLADYYLHRKRYSTATQFYIAYLAIEKNDKVAILDHARSIAFQGNRAMARQILSQTGANDAEAEKKCDSLYIKKDFKASTQCYAQLKRESPATISNHVKLIYSLTAQKNPDQAEKDAETAYILFGDDPKYIWLYADIVHRQKNFPLTITLLDEILAISPNDINAKALREIIIREKGNYKDLKKEPTKVEAKLFGR